MSIASTSHLTKLFEKGGKPALDDIDVQLPKGKIIGLVGPDGAGKTTLIRFLAGLLKPSSGSVEVLGFDTMKNPEEIHQQIGYMPQRFGLYEDLTVQQNLDLYADLHGIQKEERKKVFDKLMHFTGLQPFTDRLAKNLSGGMKQKLGLACVLVSRPKLLLLDEPSVGVDPISRRELWKMIHDLLAEEVTVLWSTSYIDEAEKCDTVILLNEGKVLFSGPPKEMTDRIKERTFKIPTLNDKRKILTDVLEEKEVEDGVIQGDAIRLLMREKEEPQGFKEVIPVPAKFEDAFIDALGGGPGGRSLLAELIQPIPRIEKEVIIADKLTKKFGSFVAVDSISFHVKQGEIFGLLGPNGAGKSTTFKMMCGLLTPTSGKSSVYGYNLQEAQQIAKSKIGYMAQKFSLYGALSVLQNLYFFSGIYGLVGSHKTKMIDRMVEIFGLKPYLKVNAEMLPLGFKQRLALACSCIHNPPVLFLDEPTSGVDPITRREFWNHINGLVQKEVTVLVTTHFMDEAEYCDRVGLVYKGKLIQIGTPDELKNIAGAGATLEDAFIKLIEQYDDTENQSLS